ncbi:hypothetical protein SK3146_03954 [Paenibacillus konkukensis]|uniref:AlgX/AlgJ SGNH hydrolase-like domain-containing protein n=1 Tax=Paenibacillus konkukensis TaxID=2020716 RepID=A0ABY4RQE5_9BACL|nr:hypothetical protein SK3146_03954 [Paenibacillus konkukensis]
MGRQDEPYYRRIAWIMLLFLGALFLLSRAVPAKTFSESENRMLAQLPAFSLDSLVRGRFTSGYEAYLADQFAARDMWIGVKSDVDRLLGKKENGGVYLGKDGYLIQKFSEPKDEEVQKRIGAIRAFGQATPNVRKFVMLVPTAAELLRDKLPRFAPASDERKVMEQVKRSLGESAAWVDVYDALDSRKDEPLFYKTDHHWTTRAAYYGYRELGRAMGFAAKAEQDYSVQEATGAFYGSLYSRSGFRHLQPDRIEIYMPKEAEHVQVEYAEEGLSADSYYEPGNLGKKDKYAVFLNGNHPWVRIRTGFAGAGCLS